MLSVDPSESRFKEEAEKVDDCLNGRVKKLRRPVTEFLPKIPLSYVASAYDQVISPTSARAVVEPSDGSSITFSLAWLSFCERKVEDLVLDIGDDSQVF